MKLTALLTGFAIAGMVTTINIPLQGNNPLLAPAYAQASTSNLTVQQKIDTITKNKGQKGSGDQLRKFFLGDLEPIGIQPGGAGMVVNLYNKANNVTFSYCSTFDVVVAVKKGKVTQFPANEVK
ncbi:hypothetical protein DO97_16065 [Neosynechococcus sphagnicola sy1]|uniref:Uncharacterized protein n=1 Tax=Neosynechococcus sphagnicola sy1 TaxID=1497020 RepID=A0A098TLG9_9CYAN|nr:hypothetical protein [Neosynechococcus sphagnicola]KGF71693.1 hypothetical protein DO97_16065 [Neosynechococcus sphagnicola sy1]